MGNEIDGKFTIAKGQGITQGIATELNLTADQCKKIKYSIWEQVMKEVDKQKESTPDLYTGGNDLKGKYSENYIVQIGQEIDLSAVWSKIVELIQGALGVTIADSDEQSTEVKNDKAEDMPEKEATPPDQDQQGATTLKNEPSDTANAGKTVTKDGVVRQYDDKGLLIQKKDDNARKLQYNIVRDSDGNVLKYTEVSLDDNGRVLQKCIRDKEGNIVEFFDYEYDENDNSVLIVERDKNGNLSSYNREVSDSNGNTTREIEYSSTGEVKCYTEYEYNENGKPKQRVVKSPDGDITDIYEYQYDENGNKTGEIHKDKDGNVIED